MDSKASVGRALAALVAAALVTGCGGGSGTGADVNVVPAFLKALKRTVYDGNTDDLLTGGLGRTMRPSCCRQPNKATPSWPPMWP